MENNKKYYWLKLKRDFFKRHDIQIIEGMQNGKDYILFYLKLLCESVDHEGNLRFSEQIPYNEQMLATITNTNVDIVRSAIKIFTELHMMEIMDDGTLFMYETNKMLGCETKWAEKKRKQRAKEDNVPLVSLPCPSDVRQEIEIDIEKELEKEKEKDKRHKYGYYKNVLLSDADFEKLKTEFPSDYEERIERLSEYIASTGKKYKSHLATIRSWARRDKPAEKVNKSGIRSDEEVYGKLDKSLFE
jgi:predicted phage replisome organizer